MMPVSGLSRSDSHGDRDPAGQPEAGAAAAAAAVGDPATVAVPRRWHRDIRVRDRVGLAAAITRTVRVTAHGLALRSPTRSLPVGVRARVAASG